MASILKLLLFIQTTGKRDRGQWYVCEPLDPDPRVAAKAWRLRRLARSEVYDVAVTSDGHGSCTCGDSTFKSQGNCKHIRALRDLGLLPKQVWGKKEGAGKETPGS